MKNKSHLVTATVTGWLIFAFSTPAIITGVFIVLGTAQPWGIIVPAIFMSVGWLLTRLDFNEKYWRRTIGEIIAAWGFAGILTALLIISRNNSMSLTLVGLPLIYCAAFAGFMLTILSPAGGKTSPQQLPPPNSR